MKNLFRDALPEIDKALRAAGVHAAGAAPPSAVSQLFGGDTTKQKGKGKGKAAAPDTSQLNQAGPLTSLLFQGSVPGEFLVPEEQVSAVDSLLARPEVRRLIPRGLDFKWGTEV